MMTRYGNTHALVVAYSGGLDSTVLLHLAANWVKTQNNVTLKAVHVHHGLHKHADSWAKQCEVVCAGHNIPVCIEHVSLTKQARRSLEEQARSARYQVLQKNLPKNGWLLTAHHQDDQAESILLALKRGCGVRGLTGIHRFGDFGQGHCLRPLLDCSRAEIEAYAQENQLTWITDSSNTDLRFDRNFLRHEILPRLNARWPAWTACASRSADYCAQQERVLTDMLTDEMARISDSDNALSIESLSTTAKINGHWSYAIGLKPIQDSSHQHHGLKKIWPEVAQARIDSNPRLTLGQYAVRRYKNRYFLLKIRLNLVLKHC